MIVKNNETILDLRTENSNLKSQLSEKYLNLNSEQKEDRFDCEKCEFYSKTQNDFEAHKLSLHEKTENFICTVCEFSSEKRYDLELHTSTKHSVNLDDKCDFKTEGQNHVENLKIFLMHLSTKHLSGKKLFKCSDILSTTRNSSKTRKPKNISIAPVTLVGTV